MSLNMLNGQQCAVVGWWLFRSHATTTQEPGTSDACTRPGSIRMDPGGFGRRAFGRAGSFGFLTPGTGQMTDYESIRGCS